MGKETVPEVTVETSGRANAPTCWLFCLLTQVTLRSPRPAGGFFEDGVSQISVSRVTPFCRVPSVLLFIYQMLIFFFKLTPFSSSLNTFVQGGNVNHKPYNGKPVIFLMLVKNKYLSIKQCVLVPPEVILRSTLWETLP